MSEVITKELSKRAGSLLSTISRGVIDTNELKNFLAQVEGLNPLPRRKKREEALAEMKAQLLKRKK